MRITLLLAVCLLASCSGELDTKTRITVHPEATGAVPGTTRTVMNPDNSVSFQAGDGMLVFDGTDKRLFMVSSLYPDGSADFIGSITGSADSYISVYPYQDGCLLYNDGVLLDIPEIQTAVPNSFDPAAAVCVGLATRGADGFNLHLRNVCSIVKFAVPEGMTYGTAILFQADDEVALTGNYYCTVTDEPVATPGYEYGDFHGHAILQGNITGGNWYYMAVNPAVLANGFALYLFDGTATDAELDTYSTYKSTENPVTLYRSQILNLGIIGAEPGAAFEPLSGETLLDW